MAVTDAPGATRSEPAGLRRLMSDEGARSIFFQTLTVACVVGLFAWLTLNTMANLAERNLSAGFGFLDVSAGFGIGFTLVPYEEGDSYLRVFWVGILNTLLVAVVAIFLATALGLVVGLARLSSNWLVRTMARWYVEILRNTPLLLQIIAWFFGVFNLLPRPRDSAVMLDVFVLNNRGFYMPSPVPQPGFELVTVAFLIALGGAIGLQIYSARRRAATGKGIPATLSGIGLLLALPLLAYLVAGAPLEWNVPELRGFNYRGGVSVPPSFCALIVALAIYTSCFIAEIVRAGIQSVGRGQIEAADALNLPGSWRLRRVVLPQALRVIIPPLISQYLNVTKNSSLAIAIGFPDLVSVWMNTSLNQSGRAIPIVAMTMAFYCAVSLAVSLAMNWYNKRVQLQER